jgi:hypothetical protein
LKVEFSEVRRPEAIAVVDLQETRVTRSRASDKIISKNLRVEIYEVRSPEVARAINFRRTVSANLPFRNISTEEKVGVES